MTSTYLSQTITAKIAADGTATATLTPPMGNFWAPSVVHIATGVTPSNTPFATSSYCAVYLGGAATQDSTSLLDDTFLGSGDTSTIISGTIVSFGTSIVAKWKNGSVGDVAIMNVYGRAYTSLVELQAEMAPVPGAKFSGSTGNGMPWEFSGFQLAGGVAFNVTPPSFTTPSNCATEILSVQITVGTSATVANRNAGLLSFSNVSQSGTAIIPNVSLIGVFANLVQVASTTWTYYFQQGIGQYATAVGASTNRVGVPLPGRCIVPPSTQILATMSNFQTGDSWSTFMVAYRQYTSNSKVSYV